MLQSHRRASVALRRRFMRLAAITLLALIVPVTPSLAQAAGHVRVKIVKAGLLVGVGAGSGVLTYRGSHAR